MTSLPKKPSGILLDIDNTLVTYSNSLHLNPKYSEVVSQLMEKGIVVSLCTGRTFATIKQGILPYFSQDQFHILAGGGQLCSADGKVHWEENMNHQQVSSLVEDLSDQTDFGFGKGNTYFCGSKNLAKYFLHHPWNISFDSAYAQQDWSCPLIVVINLSKLDTEYLRNREDLEAKIMPHKDGGFYADVTKKNVNKASAAIRWAELNQINLEEVVMIGDGRNDVEVLKVVGYPIAMGNAIPEVKELAKITIGSVEEDPVLEVIRTWV